MFHDVTGPRPECVSYLPGRRSPREKSSKTQIVASGMLCEPKLGLIRTVPVARPRASVPGSVRAVTSTEERRNPACSLKGTNVGTQATEADSPFWTRRPVPGSVRAVTLTEKNRGADSTERVADLLPTQDSFESLNWKYHLLSRAKQSIEFSPNYCGDLEFQVCLLKMQDGLARNPNLRVHLLLSPDFLTVVERTLLDEIQRKFPDRFSFLITKMDLQTSPCLCGKENHEKLLIVDGKYFILGGSGVKGSMATKGDSVPTTSGTWKDSMVSKAFRDMDVVGRGDLAQTLRVHFFEVFKTWEEKMTHLPAQNRFFAIDMCAACDIDSLETDPSLVRGAAVKALFTAPDAMDRPSPIALEIQSRLLKAVEKVSIAHMDFNPDASIRGALELVKGSHPNVQIDLITNGLTSQSPFACRFFVWSNRKNYDLVSSVSEFQIPNTLFHKKVTIIDGNITIIGSFNYSYKSAHLDNELAIVVNSAEFTTQVSGILERDRALSHQLSQAEKDGMQASLSAQVIGRLQECVMARVI